MANETVVNGSIANGTSAERSGAEEGLKFAKKLYIHGGNISNWNRIKRKTTPSSADEVSVQLFNTFMRTLILPAQYNLMQGTRQSL